MRIWNAHTHQELHVLPHVNRVYGLAFSPDGSRLATGCSDNTIRIWDTATGKDVCELRGHQAYVHAVDFSPDGTRLASASGDLTVRIWELFEALLLPLTGPVSDSLSVALGHRGDRDKLIDGPQVQAETVRNLDLATGDRRLAAHSRLSVHSTL